MVFDNVGTKVRKKQGNVGVARAVYEYTRLGYTVLAPLSDSDKYDLVIDDGDALKRVQVKTSRCKVKNYSKSAIVRTGYQVQLATSGGNTKTNSIRKRESGDYDLLFVLTESNRCWSIPAGALNATMHITVGATGTNAMYAEFEIVN